MMTTTSFHNRSSNVANLVAQLTIANLLLILSISGVYICSAARDQSFYAKPLSFLRTIFRYLDYISEFILDNVFEDKPTSGRAISDKVSYKGYQVLRLWPRSEETVEQLKWLDKEMQIQLWTPLMKNHSTDVLLPPNAVDDFKQELEDKGVQYVVLCNNLQKIIATHNPRYLNEEEKKAIKESRGHTLTWNKYHSLEDIYDYLDYLQDTYSNLVEIIDIGRSSEARPIRLVKVSTGKVAENYTKKPAIWIDAGIHGREWITPAVALFILKQLVEYHTNNKQLLNDLDWYILPVMNPDGYIYSHTTDRLWKKSRANTEGIPITKYLWYDTSTCQGVDLNRNWDYRWKRIATSTNENPCHISYAGSGPFSEPETKAVSRFVWEQRDSLLAYVSLHSYAQMWMMPLSHTKRKDADYDDLIYMGRKALEALKKTHGTQYELMSAGNFLDEEGGGSTEWAKTKAGIKYSYTVKLRDKGTYAFLLPATQIVPTGKEIFTAVRTLARSIVSSRLNTDI